MSCAKTRRRSSSCRLPAAFRTVRVNVTLPANELVASLFVFRATLGNLGASGGGLRVTRGPSLGPRRPGRLRHWASLRLSPPPAPQGVREGTGGRAVFGLWAWRERSGTRHDRTGLAVLVWLGASGSSRAGSGLLFLRLAAALECRSAGKSADSLAGPGLFALTSSSSARPGPSSRGSRKPTRSWPTVSCVMSIRRSRRIHQENLGC